MPLWLGGTDEVANQLKRASSSWENIIIGLKGTYLGFVIGPGKGTDPWPKPLEKYKQRVAKWSHVGGGMQLAATAYSTFALSTLL